MLAFLLVVVATPSLTTRRLYPSGIDVPLSKMVALGDDAELDLPCPWCLAPTEENDLRCRNCGRRFG